jgi:hypothetical protein
MMTYRLVIIICLAAALLSAQRRSGGVNTSRPSKSSGDQTSKIGNGHIQIETESKDTTIFIDEKLAGKPGKKKFTVLAGGHSVELKDAQGNSCKQNVLITPGSTAKVSCTPTAAEASSPPK